MARPRNEGFASVLTQLKPLTWLIGISFVILLISLAILSFTYDPTTKESRAFELVKDEPLQMGDDFDLEVYSHKEAETKLFEDDAPMLSKNLDIVQLIHVERLDNGGHFTKGFILRFSIPEDEDRVIDPKKLSLGYYSPISEKWIPLSYPRSRKEDILYEIKETRYGFYGMGIFTQEAKKDEDQEGKKDPDGDTPKKEPIDDNNPPLSNTPTIAKQVSGRLFNGRELVDSPFLTLELSGIHSESGGTAIAEVNARIVARISGNNSELAKVIEPGFQIRWFRTRQDVEDGNFDEAKLVGPNAWSFRKIYTQLPGEWEIIFQIVDPSDDKVYAEGAMPLSVRDR